MGRYGKGIVKVLSTKTFNDFNIKFSELPDGSHVKIFVKCTRCGEEFLRERRNLHQLHACPTHITRDDGLALKWCNNCASFLAYKCFSNNSARYDKLASWCKTCSNQTQSS